MHHEFKGSRGNIRLSRDNSTSFRLFVNIPRSATKRFLKGGIDLRGKVVPVSIASMLPVRVVDELGAEAFVAVPALQPVADQCKDRP